jgi:hypothetical protein
MRNKYCAKGNPCRRQWLQDLEDVFKEAMACEKFSAALKAKEMIARDRGWMKTSDINMESRSLSTWSDEEIDRVMSLLEKSIEAETGVEPTYKDLQSSA